MEVSPVRRFAAPSRPVAAPAGDEVDGVRPRHRLLAGVWRWPRPRSSWIPALPLVGLAAGAWAHRWVAEDAFITFRVVDMTLAGHPLLFNAGERVEAATSPLWLWMLIALQATLGHLVDLAWLSVILGLAFTLAGGGLVVAASVALARAVGYRGVMWPAGALVLAVVAPLWDFATSGLETGLAFAWLGASYWLLLRRLLGPPGSADAAGSDGDALARPGALDRWWVPVTLGVGPLIRPDLALFSGVFVVVLVVTSRSGWARRGAAVALALAAPVAYEIFRMAYFASLVPNPALTKEAGEAQWSRGLDYLTNLVEPYHLLVAAALLAGWALLAGLGSGVPRRIAPVLLAPVVGGALHALFILRVGGDFMHGRLLLPGLFALCLPVAALPVTGPSVGIGGRALPVALLPALALAGWAGLCAASWRSPEPSPTRWPDIADERLVWDGVAHRANAVTLADHQAINAVGRGAYARERAAAGVDLYVPFLDVRDADRIGPSPVPDLYGPELRLAPGSGVVFHGALLGMASMAAGPDVEVRDHFGIADPLGGRLDPLPANRPGHQKPLALPYHVATLPLADPADADRLADPEAVAAARRVLDCPAVRELRVAISEPLSLGRLLRNIRAAPRLTGLRLPRDSLTVRSCDDLR
jgi:arabinofuranosyltransferase